jgi:hypothetical protein
VHRACLHCLSLFSCPQHFFLIQDSLHNGEVILI